MVDLLDRAPSMLVEIHNMEILETYNPGLPIKLTHNRVVSLLLKKLGTYVRMVGVGEWAAVYIW